MRLDNRNIVCLASQDFDDLWTRKQRWMTRLAGRNRVFWVNLQLHAVTWGRRLPGTRKRLFGRPPREIQERLWVYTPPVTLPGFQISQAICRVHNFALTRALRPHLKRLGFTDNLLWLYTPYNARQIGRLFDTERVYECVDDFTAARGLIRAATVRQLERQTLGKVDLTIVTSPRLAERFAGATKRLIISPNGADVDHFAAAGNGPLPIPADLGDVLGPVIGFLGSVSYWVDVPLIAELARSRPDWMFVLVGPVRTNVRPFAALPNVRALGHRPYAALPAYLRRFDVCLNPYRIDGVADSASPLKLYEYLATGKPIVSSPMPEARRFSPLVAIAETPNEYLTAIQSAITENSNGHRERQMSLARQHDWSTRFDDLERELEQVPGQ